eukprot:5064789-Pyramimonas_sp.AAC.1
MVALSWVRKARSKCVVVLAQISPSFVLISSCAAPPVVVDHSSDDGVTCAPAPVDHSSDDEDVRVAAAAAGAGARPTSQGSKFAVITLGLQSFENNP